MDFTNQSRFENFRTDDVTRTDFSNRSTFENAVEMTSHLRNSQTSRRLRMPSRVVTIFAKQVLNRVSEDQCTQGVYSLCLPVGNR